VLVTPVLQVVHRVITRHLLDQAGFKAFEADSGAVTRIQRLGLLPISTDTCIAWCWTAFTGAPSGPVFVQADSPTDEALQGKRCCTRSSRG